MYMAGLTMATTYEIRVRGHLPQHWSEWLGGLTVTHDPNGDTILTGPLPDQAALFGVMVAARDLGLTLLSVNQVGSEPPGEDKNPSSGPPHG
jgi:hypothetical protein